MRGSFPWTEEAVSKLRIRWAAGDSTAKIGRDLGCGKNAVIGKARRIGLPAREQPIAGRWAQPGRLGGAAEVERARAITTPTPHRDDADRCHSQDLSSPVWPAAGTADATPGGPREAAGASQRGVRAVPAAPSISHRAHSSADGCAWLEGYPKPGWRWCDAPRERGSYCAEHGARVYQPRPAAGSEEAA